MPWSVSLSGGISAPTPKNYFGSQERGNIMARTAKNNQVETNAKAPVQVEVIKNITTLKLAIDEARQALQASADKRNEARVNGDLAAIEVAKANARDLEKACAKACKDAAFYELAFSNENPILAAIKAKSYMTYVLKDIKDKDTDSVSTEVESKEVFISLKEMDTYCTTHGVKGSVDKAWSGEYMALAGAIVAQIVLGFTDADKRDATIKALEADYYFSKALTKHKAALENADLADPTSKTQVMKLGQAMVDHLVGEGYVFKVEDYEFLKAVATTYDKRSQDADVMKSRDLYSVNNKVFQHIVYKTPYQLKAGK
jgi:hypothetical protein